MPVAAETPPGNERREVARWFEASLRERVMPYWLRTTPDQVHGGYRLRDRHDPHPTRRRISARQIVRKLLRRPAPPPPPPRKYLVTQSRMLYGFSLAHRLGLGSGSDDYLQAAEVGYRFLSRVMLDPDRGGLVTVTEEDGTVIDARKLLCGHAFAIYGLVEYHRASGERTPLQLALELYRMLQERLHDDVYGGWIEHADREFRPLRLTFPVKGLVGVPELKSGDTLLHWMEALSELSQATGDAGVAASLAEALHFNRTCFFPADDAVAYPLRTREWRPIGGSRYQTLSYGHNVEFAWLMIRAQEVLGCPPSWDHFDALLGHALRHSFDHERGGFFFGGRADRPATDRRKAWWVQAEALAALTDRVRHQPQPVYESALDRLVDWILRYQVLEEDGIWVSVLDEGGRPLDLTKAGPWKGAYHDVRAMAKYIAAFR